MNFIEVKDQLEKLTGKIAVNYISLDSGERFDYNSDTPLIAASVIKLAIMAAAFRLIEEGGMSETDSVIIPHSAKMPSCGALTYMHDNIDVQIIDLITLMIILSDNTATNLLIDRIGIEYINDTISLLGLSTATRLNRKLFDREQAAKGIENYITAADISKLLFMLYRGEAISSEASEKMIGIMKNQRLNGKIPFFLHSKGIVVAHKTGEDSGITHDVGIIYSDKPFILSFLSNEADVPRTERAIQDIAQMLVYR